MLASKVIKSILLTLIVVLLYASFWYKKQYEASQDQLAFATDTLAHLHYNYISEFNKWSDYPEIDHDIKEILGPKNLEIGDTLIEIHRIIWTTSFIHSFLIQQNKNGTVILDYRKFTLQNPVTKIGKTEVLASERILVSEHFFQQFKEKLAAISFLDATQNEDPMCCFTSGLLRWEARLCDNLLHKHSTWCHQSVEFTEACEILMRLPKDPRLQLVLRK